MGGKNSFFLVLIRNYISPGSMFQSCRMMLSAAVLLHRAQVVLLVTLELQEMMAILDQLGNLDKMVEMEHLEILEIPVLQDPLARLVLLELPDSLARQAVLVQLVHVDRRVTLVILETPVQPVLVEREDPLEQLETLETEERRVC